MAEPANDTERAGGAQVAEPIVIKKYANRRLYNTATSSYVTLEHLSEMVREGADFLVLDAKTGEDITRSVLAQIIFEQENRGETLLPVQFLRRLIRFYGHNMQTFLPSYLEMSMEAFAKGQEQWREQMSRTWVGRTPLAAFEEQTRQNMAMFDQAMRMWSAPYAPGGQPPNAQTVGGQAPAGGKPPEAAADPDALGDMKKQLEAMQKQLDQLSGGRKV